jgi:large subunit ribosomal protein L25
MPEQLNIKAQMREITGKRVRNLRAQGIVPANLSGDAKPSVAIQLPADELNRLLKRHGAGVLRLHIGAASRAETALLNRVERNPITSAVLHVDFRRVRLNQPVHARVPVHVTGEAAAIKIQGGVLLHLLDHVEIEALPANIPEAVTLDISSLEELNSTLTVAEIQLPGNVKMLSPEGEAVVSIKAPRIEVPEVEAPAAAPEAAPETAPEAEQTASESESAG